jgi:hypothetical protein
MKDSQIRERLQKGWVRAIITFEVVGKPAKHVEKALADFMENIKKDERIVFLREEMEPALEHEDGMFGTFCEAEMLVQNLEVLTWLSINFSPASIEIVDPDTLHIPARDVQNWLNDLLAKVHEVGSNHRTQISATENLTVAMNQLIQNIVLLSLRGGAKSEEQLEQETGIHRTQLDPFTKHLTEKGQIVKAGDTFRLAQAPIIAVRKAKK